MTVTHCSCDRGCPIFFTWWVDSSHVASAKVSSVEWHRNRSHCLACVHQGTLMTARRDQKQIKLLNKLYVTEDKKAKARILESCEIWEQQMEPNSLGLLVKGFTCSLVFCLKKTLIYQLYSWSLSYFKKQNRNWRICKFHITWLV